jgi:hypothetical protein
VKAVAALGARIPLTLDPRTAVASAVAAVVVWSGIAWRRDAPSVGGSVPARDAAEPPGRS